MNSKISERIVRKGKFIKLNGEVSEGNVIYEGEFIYKELNGKGKITWFDGTIYEGEFKDGELNGEGKITSFNGTIKKGNFINGKINGRGKFIWPSGDKYEGEWIKGYFNGQGIYTYHNGDKYEGNWKDDKRIGKGILTKSNGKIYTCEYENGELINKVCININPQISNLKKIANFVKIRNIQNIYHFTNINNLESIIKNGILSRDELKNKPINYSYNDEKRLDGYTNASCFSIGFPNYKMFHKQKHNSNDKWCVIELDSSLLYEKDCIFSRHNAASSEEKNRDINSRKGILGLEFMFCNEYNGLNREDLNIPTYYPTNPQAEVLIFGTVEPKYIKRIIMQTNEDVTRFSQLYKTINIEQNQEFFGPRVDWKFW